VPALLATTAGLLLMAFVLWANEHGRLDVSPPAVVTVESIHGAVMFRDSQTDRLLAVGEPLSLPAGTLVLEGDTAALQCRFFDGTLITLTGDTEAKLADEDQKRVRLSRGELTAEVTPQTAGRPMIIETPTARVEVLGTVLSLSAEADRTSVRVDSGRVRLSRLVDGRAVEIDYNHACIASLDPREDLQPLPTASATGVWRYEFAEPPPARWKGQWLAASGGEPGRVRVVPCIVGRKDEAQPIIHFGVTARRVDGIDLGRLPADATLRIGYRLTEPAPLRIMLGVNRPDGRFGGNFETKLSSRSVVADHGRWQWLEIPLSRLKPLVPRFPAMAEGDRPYLILITTFEEDAGLEIAELSITEHEEQHP
jgi:hypothetical protein